MAPATQTAGAHPGQSFGYHMTLRNRGANADSYALSVASNWSAKVLDSSCSALDWSPLSRGVEDDSGLVRRLTFLSY